MLDSIRWLKNKISANVINYLKIIRNNSLHHLKQVSFISYNIDINVHAYVINLYDYNN